MLTIGIPKEKSSEKPSEKPTPDNPETRVATSPETIKKLTKMGFQLKIESGAGNLAGFPDSTLSGEGVEFVDASQALGCDLVFKINPPTPDEVNKLKAGSYLICLLEPYKNQALIQSLAQKGVNAFSLELIPRTSRAQSMDVLSSQANIAGYRAVLEATAHYGRFFPMMMTSAGSAKPAKFVVLGVGVAGLQAIGTARRLGAQVEAYDVRPETREQILSLGGKPIDLEIGDQGSGTGGYARELTVEAKAKQQALLQEYLKKADIILTTANVPGRKAPTLVTEEGVRGMKPGSVIIDMAAPSGGNCALTKPGQVVDVGGVKIVGWLNYAAMVPTDASNFFSRNILNLLNLFYDPKEKTLKMDLKDDIIDASLVTYQNQVRMKN